MKIEYESSTVLPQEIVKYFEEHEKWVTNYRYESDKLFIGVGELRKKIMVWFMDHQVKEEK